MNSEEFEKIMNHRLDYARLSLTAKGDIYSPLKGDRLQNFRSGGALCLSTEKQYLFNLASKHIIALRDFVDAEAHGRSISYSNWEEKIGDIINYMILLDSIVREGKGIIAE